MSRRYEFTFRHLDSLEERVAVGIGNTRASALRSARARLRDQIAGADPAQDSTMGITKRWVDVGVRFAGQA